MPGPANALNITEAGLQSFDGVSIFHGRTLTAGTGVIITNGNGVSGNPVIGLSGSGAAVEHLTGNTGGQLNPDGSNNFNVLGSGSITIAGSGSTLTSQLTGLTNHAVQVGAGTSTLTQLTVGTNGQVLIGASAANPAFATLTSSDSSITFTTGANTLSLQVAGGATVVKTITGNTGGAESPTAGNFNILGTGSITIAGTANTETVQMTGLTNHSVLVGAGTATITKVGPSGSTGIPLISQGASADPLFGTAAIAGGGTNATSMSTSTGIVKYNGTSLVTSTTATIDANNIYKNTAQPAVYAQVQSVAQDNVTGDGTVYTIIFDGVGFDQASNYNATTGIFTAPVTGRYFAATTVGLNNATVANTFAQVNISTTTRNQYFSINPSAILSGTKCSFAHSSFLDLSAGDTCKITIQVSNGVSATVGVHGNDGGAYSFFSIWLVT